MPPSGIWRPTISLLSVLQAVKVLLAEPNPDDPLMPDIAREFLMDRDLYTKKASMQDQDGSDVNRESVDINGSANILPPKGLLSLKRRKRME